MERKRWRRLLKEAGGGKEQQGSGGAPCQGWAGALPEQTFVTHTSLTAQTDLKALWHSRGSSGMASLLHPSWNGS